MNIEKHIYGKVSIAPLVTFRVIFGGMMLGSIVRFWLMGWINELYIQPSFFFTYFGFEWVKPLEGDLMYAVFFLLGLSALMIMLGFLYRISSLLFFLLFTYVELIDVTTYLNHYYFISIVALLMVFVPANKAFSLDVKFKITKAVQYIEAWSINAIKLQLGIVYFFAGVAKIHPDWLIEAQPMRIWLAARTDMPILGPLFDLYWVPFFFSWAGCLYDLFIPFLLLNKYTRPISYLAVLFFHIVTAMLFPIGMFPYIMILSTLIFFPEKHHIAFWNWFNQLFRSTSKFEFSKSSVIISRPKTNLKKLSMGLLTLHFLIQFALPFRYALYPGNLFWTEQGYRFSWRVMLMEKAGHITFYVKNLENGHMIEVNNRKHLTELQEKMMATQSDMILQYAKHLKKYYQDKGVESLEIYVKSYVTLNGRASKTFIDPKADLSKIEDSFAHKTWIVPFENQERIQ